MKRYEVCARGYAWLAERESADGLWVKYDEAAAECDELRQQLTKANTMLLFTRAERDSLQQQLAAAQERELLLSNDLVYALDLAIAYAPAKADQEWAAEMMEQLSPLKEA